MNSKIEKIMMRCEVVKEQESAIGEERERQEGERERNQERREREEGVELVNN